MGYRVAYFISVKNKHVRDTITPVHNFDCPERENKIGPRARAPLNKNLNKTTLLSERSEQVGGGNRENHSEVASDETTKTAPGKGGENKREVACDETVKTTLGRGSENNSKVACDETIKTTPKKGKGNVRVTFDTHVEILLERPDGYFAELAVHEPEGCQCTGTAIRKYNSRFNQDDAPANPTTTTNRTTSPRSEEPTNRNEYTNPASITADEQRQIDTNTGTSN